jgi:uncharacterized protein
MERRLTIEVAGSGSITAIESPPAGTPTGWRFIYAPGASANVNDPFGVFASEELTRRGLSVVRIQFPYREAGRRSPDREPILEAAWIAAIEHLSSAGQKLVIGGRSMGGRIASQVVAQGARADALALFAYPLHPPGKPELRRDGHLSALDVPVFFCSGTNDAFASPDELREAAALVPKASVHLLNGADHGFNMRKASGLTREKVWTEAVWAMWEWLSEK